jgi:hypothetical protein
VVGVRIALAAAAVTLAVAACTGGDPSPTTLPTASSPPPPTATQPTAAPPTTPPSTTPAPPTAPPLPPTATQDTPTGAESFARHWLATLDYAYKTGDTVPFRELGGCKSCTALTAGIDDFYATGGRFEGGTFTADRVQTTKHVKGSAALVDLVYSRSAGKAVPAAGAPRVTPAESGTEFILTLERGPKAWQVATIKTVTR